MLIFTSGHIPLFIITVGQAAFAIIIGALPLLFMPVLANNFLLISLGCFSILLWRHRRCWSQWLSISLLSLIWCTYSGQRILQPIYQYTTKQPVTIIGQVLSTNITVLPGSGIMFLVKSIDGHNLTFFQQFRVLLRGNLENYDFYAGQYWRIKGQLRPVHSRLNQGGFDSQRWAITNHYSLTALVYQGELINAQIGLRQRIINSVAKQINNYSTADILFALSFGERSLMNMERKTLMITTGVAHLMAISGLHIVMAGLLGFYVIRGIQFFLPTTYINSRVAHVIAWLCAAYYVWLAGAEPPALRTIVAMTIWLILHRQGYLWSSWQIFIVTVAILILCDPVTILSESTWLSCYAVFCLIFWYQLAPLPSRFNKWYLGIIRFAYLQLAITLLLLPLQIWLFHGVSWSSLAANFIAVPIISFITVPIILFALLATGLAIPSEWLWFLADKSLQIVLPYLNMLQIAWQNTGQAIMPLSFLGWFFLFIIRLSLWRSHPILLISLLIVSILPQWYKPKNLWQMDILDVGHGLAIVIHKDKHAILYDTGNRWPEGSMAQREIIPYLRWHQLQLDGIILSHQDNDHIGGLNELTQLYPQIWLYSSSRGLNGQCITGQHFQWQELDFEVLWPPVLVSRAHNADSCVIRLSDGQHNVLLTGDLEGKQELALVANASLRQKLSADILLTPHHGSATSSSGPFLRAVRPSATIASAARYSPWRLPAEKIYKRYHDEQIDWYDTAHSGQISVLFFKDNFEIKRYRDQLMPRWYHNWFGTSRYNE